jgi:hypothetical protein
MRAKYPYLGACPICDRDMFDALETVNPYYTNTFQTGVRKC